MGSAFAPCRTFRTQPFDPISHDMCLEQNIYSMFI
jgi:hypothetical protein